MNSPSRSGSTPPLLLLAGDVDLDQHLGLRGRRGARSCSSDRVAGDRVDQPHERQDPLQLAALQVADEVPGKARAEQLALRLQVLEAVLADQLDPRPRRGAPSPPRRRTWSRRGSRPRARSAREPRSRFARARRRGRCRGSAQPSIQTSPAWRPVAPGVAAVGEEELGLAARAEPAGLDLARPRPRASSRRATSGRSSIRPSAIPSPSARERREHLRRRPRSSRGRSRARSPRRSRRPPRTPRATIPAGEPAPAAVEHRHPASPASATGRQSATWTSGVERRVRRSTWPSPRAIAGRARLERSERVRRGGRSRAGRPRRRGPGGRTAPRSGSTAERRGEPGAVLAHRRRLIVGVEAEVERLERRPR